MTSALFTAACVLLFAMCGLSVYRLRGSDDNPPRPIMQLTFVLPYALIVFVHLYAVLHLPVWFAFCGFVCVMLVATPAVLTGHGNFQDLGTWREATTPEEFEFIIAPLHKTLTAKDGDDYWYDALGLMLMGVLVTAPPGILLHSGAIALSGALEAPAYMIGSALTKRGVNKFAGMAMTEIGEMLTGFLLWGALALWVAS